MPKKMNKSLDVVEVMEEFQKSEAKSGHRKDAFKIDGSFEDAVKRIAKDKPHKKPGLRGDEGDGLSGVGSHFSTTSSRYLCQFTNRGVVQNAHNSLPG